MNKKRNNMSEEKVIKSYKGFDKDLKCRGYQYEVGKEYELPEGQKVKVCNTGFHACESPLEVLDHYAMFDGDGNENRFCEVDQSGDIDRESGTTKVASSRIRINAEIGLAGLIKAGIEWIKEVTRVGRVNNSGDLNDKGGDRAQIGSSGYGAKIGSSGDRAQIGSSGYEAQIGSSGDGAQIGSSGDGAKIGSSGYGAKIGSSGYEAQITSTGEDCVICCAGHGSRVRAKVGSWVTLAEWKFDKEKKRYVPACVKTIYIDGETYKADTWYKLENGGIKEA